MRSVFESFTHAGIECEICPGTMKGSFNGYVLLPEWLRRFHHDTIPVRVHGGLTYKNAAGWVGFDTAHCDDFWPGGEDDPFYGRASNTRAIVWSIEKLRLEVRALAEQLAALQRFDCPCCGQVIRAIDFSP